MSSTVYDYAPSANGSVDRSAASSQRRVRQQNAYRVSPRDGHEALRVCDVPHMSYEEDTCVSYEEEDTCVSYEEEDTCVSYE